MACGNALLQLLFKGYERILSSYLFSLLIARSFVNSSFKSLSLLGFLVFCSVVDAVENVPEDHPGFPITLASDFLKFERMTSHGKIEITDPAAGVSTYIPDGNYSGLDSFVWISRQPGGPEVPHPEQIVLIPENDPPAIISYAGQSPYGLDVQENSTFVTDVNGTDAEQDDLNYTIDSQATFDSVFFDINKTSGALFFNYPTNFENPEDKDSNNTYEVVVVVSEVGKRDNNDTQKIIVTVTDENDPPEILERSTVTVSMDEDNATLGWRDPELEAVDPDLNQTATLSWEIWDATNGAWDVSVVTTNGVASVSAAGGTPDLTYVPTPDFNGTDSFKVRVSDAKGLTDEITVNVEVANVNDLPVFDFSTLLQPIKVFENQVAVMDLNVTDADVGDIHTFSLSTGEHDGALFDINATTGVLSFLAPPNYEANSSASGNNVFNVEVVVTDNTAEAIPVTELIRVSVENANDVPLITSHSGVPPYPLSIPENQLFVADLNATDEDGDPLTYSLDVEDQVLFEVNASSGVLTFRAPPDYEIPASQQGGNSYYVDINVTDGKGGDASQTFAITVTNKLDQPPVFVWANASATGTAELDVIEPQTFIVDLNATDPDNSITGFSIAGGADRDLFDVNGSGALVFLLPPDYESPTSQQGGNSYYVDVNVTDGIYSATQPVVVRVLDLDEVPPSWGGGVSPLEISVNEGTTHVLDLNATDNNASKIIYSISAVGADGSLFAIDQNASPPGLVFIQSPDFESPASFAGNNTYKVEVTASDGLNPSLQPLEIEVSDVNESPYFVDSNFTLAEDSNLSVLEVTDPEGQPVYRYDSPQEGNLTKVGNDLFYVPKANFAGSDSFVMYLTDGTFDENGTASPGALEANGTISLNISEVNDPPVANPDTYFRVNDQVSYRFDVDLNDTSYPDNPESFVVSITRNPVYGRATIAGGGIVYLPPSQYFIGEDSFTYEIRDRPVGDSTGLSDSATVTLYFTSNPLVPGWYHYQQFGTFYQSGNSWIYHEEMGWVYSPSVLQPKQNSWMWHHDLGWFWTGDVFPYVYLNDLYQWKYLSFHQLPKILFYAPEVDPPWLDASLLTPARLWVLLRDLSTVGEASAAVSGFNGISTVRKNIIRVQLSLEGKSDELSNLLGVDLQFGR
jgi:hypothetical protein